MLQKYAKKENRPDLSKLIRAVPVFGYAAFAALTAKAVISGAG